LDNSTHKILQEVLNRKLERPSNFVGGVTTIPLGVPTFGPDEILESIDSLLSRNVTMGAKVSAFEQMFAEYLDVSHSVMVNSGSSANLVALSALTSTLAKHHIKPGDEVITPAVTWSTTVFPIVCVGAVPVFVDVDLDTMNINPSLAEKAIGKKTAAIMPVHLIGNPCDMESIQAIANEHNLFVVEDACEAPGAELNGKKVGTFGDIGTFSFFFSHHITTIEGGMVVTEDSKYADLARSLRAHGWVRERSDNQKLAMKYRSLNSRFLFVTRGYNLRPTEIQGAFGIHQLAKLEDLIRIRENNADYWSRELSKYSDFLILPKTRPGSRHVYFGYPVMVRSEAPFKRDELVSYLERKRVETRPIMAGNFTQQPVFSSLPSRIVGKLRNAKLIHTSSFFWGNHQGIGEAERRFIVECVSDFIEKRKSRRKVEPT